MYSKNIVTSVFFVGALCTLTSCVKYYDIVNSEFPQGTDQPDQSDITARYSRTQTVYDQFTTQAVFSVLWLADGVRAAYVDLHCDKRGLMSEPKEQMLKRQLEENKHWISFYVLADIRDKSYASLSDKSAFWTMSVQVDDDKPCVPESIKEVELEPEYQAFVGKCYNHFKVPYLVKCPITDAIAEKLTRSDFETIKLSLQSPFKKCVLTWDRKDIVTTNRVVNDEDFYWG